MGKWSLILLLVLGGCSRQEAPVAPIRFIDVFADATVEGTPAVDNAPYEKTEWSFEGDDATEWRAIQGVSELSVVDGVLKCRTSSETPVIAARRTSNVPASDLLHAVEIRARSRSGMRLAMRVDRGDALVVPRLLAFSNFAGETAILAGDQMRTYVLRPNAAFHADQIDHVALLPTNAAGAELEIDSLRLVFRGEHLRAIPSGVGWHGMSEIYRESLVTRSPETVRFDVELPEAPALEIAVGIVEKGPVTFRVDVTPEDSKDTRTYRTVVDEPDRWEPNWIDLEELSGRRARIAFSLEAKESGTLGFWGTPAVRSNASLDDGAPQGVLLVITDTLRADHSSLYGYERQTTPTLARLAREGVLFENAISQSTWTKVSVPSIETAMYPTSHTIGDIPDRLPASATTIAEVFRRAGYATFGMTRNPFTGQFSSLHQGYEVLHESGSASNDEDRPVSHLYVDRLLSWIASHRRTRFFALLHVTDPHGPFRPRPDFENAFAEVGEMDRLDELVREVRPHIRDSVMRVFGAPRIDELEEAGIDPETFVRYEHDGYDGKIRGMDAALETLIEGLEANGLSDKVLVAVVSDHGEEFLEHGGHSHGHTVYGELNRVPMLLWGPAFVPRGVRVDAIVETIDLMPTLLELSGLTVPELAQGQSLTSLFGSDGVERWNRPAITELPAHEGRSIMTALISEGWKLVRIDGDDPESARFELYRYDDDPTDQRDVAEERPEVVARLKDQLERFEQFARTARLDDEAAAQTMDAEELERLRSLGYVK